MLIRAASESDLGAVRSLLVETWHATYDALYGRERVRQIVGSWHSPAALKARLERHDSAFLLAEEGGQICGMAFAAATEDGGTVMLHQLYVMPCRHGQGIGGQLLAAVENAFPRASRIRLEVEEGNSRAVAFYRARGFLKVGCTDNCGQEQSDIPAAIYEKPLER